MSSWSEESIRGKAVREQETVARLVRAGKEGERQGTYSKRLGKESLTCWTFPSRYEVRDDVRWSNYSQNLRKTILVSILIDMVALVSVVLFSGKGSVPWDLTVAAILGTTYWLTDRNRATVVRLLYWTAIGASLWAVLSFI